MTKYILVVLISAIATLSPVPSLAGGSCTVRTSPNLIRAVQDQLIKRGYRDVQRTGRIDNATVKAVETLSKKMYTEYASADPGDPDPQSAQEAIRDAVSDNIKLAQRGKFDSDLLDYLLSTRVKYRCEEE